MKGKLIVGALLLALALAAPAQAGLWAKMEAHPAVLYQGQAALVRAYMGPWERVAEPPYLRFRNDSAAMVEGRGGWWFGFVGVDLDTQPGPHNVEVTLQGKVVGRTSLRVMKKDYGTREITVEQQYVEPDPAQLLRHQQDADAQRAVYASRLPQLLWGGGWQRPTASEVVGVFGRRSVVNGQPRSPHGGVDLRGGVGAPVQAPAAGRVALVRDTFMSGLVVLIDHGLGMITGYRHLSQAKVKMGQEVAKGQVIGLVGATGRVTGPHLHYDLKVMGARVDPLAWTELSRELGKYMGNE